MSEPKEHASRPASRQGITASLDNDSLLDRGLRRALRRAAEDPGLDIEIGALRLTLARLLNEEHNPSRLAAGIARIAGAAVQIARLRNPPADESTELRAIFLRELAALDAELPPSVPNRSGSERL